MIFSELTAKLAALDNSRRTLEGSYERTEFWLFIFTAFVVLGSIVWISHIVYKTHAIPALDGVTLFNTSIYGMGKINETIQKGLK